ncbi:MAG TPA: PH domain-containing protein [Geobacteraceae bacterium]|nr:PH domain-containing protein [Geobacteraceae bacterium]
MQTSQHFSVAPWTRTLKLVSLLGTTVIIVGGAVAYRKISVFSGFPLILGYGVVSILAAIPIVSLLFTVTGYLVEGNVLHVERLLWSTTISLEGLSKVWQEPSVCKGSIRIFGNGGLYSFTGVYQNKTLGRYRLFATDLTKSTVLVLPRRTVVVTPLTPQVFIDYMRRRFPSIE